MLLKRLFRRSLAHTLVGALLTLSSGLAGVAIGQTSVERLGLVDVRPPEGHFVETDKGFMVPYQATLPGTNVTFEMIPVPGGKYEMTRHGVTFTVEVAPFWIGRTEVTWAEYSVYMQLATAFDQFDDRGIRQITSANQIDAITAPSKLYEPSFTFESGDQPTQPAVSMMQYSAKQYTKWLSLTLGDFYRLPAEAEWEYACGAGSTAAYSFGDGPAELEKYAWFAENTGDQLGHVAQKRPNAWGIYDMHGNAAEWVLDAYEASEEEGSKNPAAGNTVSVEKSILWPTEAYPLTLKGGSWRQPADECTTRSRLASHDDDWRSNDPNFPQSPWWYASDEGQQVGFRLVRPLAVPSREAQEKYWQPAEPRILAHANRRIDEEGRGERGLVDPELPKAIEGLKQP